MTAARVPVTFVPVDVVRTGRGADATTLLTFYLVLLWAIPSAMIVPALGSAGGPASLVGVGCFFWWAWCRVQQADPSGLGVQPVRVAMLTWMLIMLVVYAHAMAGPIPGDEISVADNGILRMLAMGGVLLLANDGITTYDRFQTFVRRLALAAGAVAVLGLVQYGTHQLWVDRLSIPGLVLTSFGTEVGGRGGFVRPSGTSASPIEYGVVLAIALPVVIALCAKSQRNHLVYRLLLLPMIISIYFSVSRSAYLCALIGVAVLAMSWNGRQRIAAFFVLIAATAGMYVSVPGLLGTIVGLFSNASEDPSVASRTASYDIAGVFVANSPIVGRGFGTFLPRYWILDNGYLGLLIEGGVVGLVGLLAVFVSGVLAARQARRWSTNDGDRQLATALMASIVAGATGMAFFDTFSFPQSAGGVFLALGLAGAMRSIMEQRRTEPQVS